MSAKEATCVTSAEDAKEEKMIFLLPCLFSHLGFRLGVYFISLCQRWLVSGVLDTDSLISSAHTVFGVLTRPMQRRESIIVR